jgi:phosphoenolpyruvate-protein kinase (PTS system EI component)
MERYDTETKNAIDAVGRECTTRNGIQIHLFANIGRPFEVHQVAEHHLEGVGLFRTEYLFLDEPVAPSFERQREMYCQVAASLDGLPLVIRTLDLGGDKWPAFLKPRFEANPNLGVRGLRFSLVTAEDLFRTQIRAMLHAATVHDVRIMLPMVLGRADLQHAVTIIKDVAREDGVASLPPIGALIETPSAVFSIDEILAACDFISIGTNDLTQFMLAADRNALAMIDDYTVLHPSVLRAVHRIIDAAHAAGKPATVCGEAAADPRVACLLIGLGARRLSMSPVSTARVRFAVRNLHMPSLEELARTALNSDSPQTVSALLTELLNSTFPELRPDFVYV